jgi:Restriction endonuclease
MSVEQWRGVALAASVLAGLIALGLLIVLRLDRRRRLAARPSWERMLADPDYFKQSVWRILRARGCKVRWARGYDDSIERQPREVVFALIHRGELVAALCGRWVIPITSEIITRFDRALATTRARRGMIITTSWFTDAAIEAAQGRPVELLDGKQLAAWIEDIWG